MGLSEMVKITSYFGNLFVMLVRNFVTVNS